MARQQDLADPAQRAARARHLLELRDAVLLGAVGALGALPAIDGKSDSLALLTWIAWIAAASGCIFPARGRDLWRFGAVAPAIWMAALALVDGRAEHALPAPAWAAAAWTGLFFAGAALGRIAPDARWRNGAALLLVAAVLSALPARGGLPGAPLPPRATAVLLDVSPVVLLAETAGVRDHMWHRSLYGPAGVDRFARAPWSGPLAAGTVLLVGCALALGAGRVGRRGARAGDGAQRPLPAP